MKPTDPNSPPIFQYDIRLGWSRRVPDWPDHRWRPAVAHAVAAGKLENGFHFEVLKTPYILQVNTEHAADGNLGLWVASGTTMGTGNTIPPKTPLYSASLACLEATAPLAWRQINNQYLRHMLGSPFEANFHAAGMMPRVFPWLCGFPEVCAGRLDRPDWECLITVVRLAGQELLVRGRQAVRDAAAKGIVPVLDPGLFLELNDWTD